MPGGIERCVPAIPRIPLRQLVIAVLLLPACLLSGCQVFSSDRAMAAVVREWLTNPAPLPDDESFQEAVEKYGDRLLPFFLAEAHGTLSTVEKQRLLFAVGQLPHKELSVRDYNTLVNLLATGTVFQISVAYTALAGWEYAVSRAGIPGDRMRDDFTNLLRSEAPLARECACYLIEALNTGTGHHDPLLFTARNDPDFYVRLAAARTIHRLGGVRRHEPLYDVFATRDRTAPPFRASPVSCPRKALEAILTAIIRSGKATFIPGPYDPLGAETRTQEDLRVEALETIRFIDAEELAPFVQPLLKDPSPDVRSEAAAALADFLYYPAVPELIELLRDPDVNVRGSAAYALNVFSEDVVKGWHLNPDIQAEYHKWLKWWESYKKTHPNIEKMPSTPMGEGGQQ